MGGGDKRSGMESFAVPVVALYERLPNGQPGALIWKKSEAEPTHPPLIAGRDYWFVGKFSDDDIPQFMPLHADELWAKVPPLTEIPDVTAYGVSVGSVGFAEIEL